MLVDTESAVTTIREDAWKWGPPTLTTERKFATKCQACGLGRWRENNHPGTSYHSLANWNTLGWSLSHSGCWDNPRVHTGNRLSTGINALSIYAIILRPKTSCSVGFASLSSDGRAVSVPAVGWVKPVPY